MQKNPKLLLIVGAVCLLLIVGLFWTDSKSSDDSANQTSATKPTKKDIASGDTENEVLRTVLANQEQLKSENKTITEENKQLKEKGLKSVSAEIQASKQKLQTEIEKIKSAVESKLEAQQKDISQLKTVPDSGKKEAFEVNGGSAWQNDDSSPHVIQSVPDLSSAQPENKRNLNASTSNDEQGVGDLSLPSDSNNEKNALKTFSSSDNQAAGSKNGVVPYYTIPANSTLNHVKLMTSIIGEVPISGKLVAPAFPFKAIVGRKELYAANGMSLPADLSGTVVQGYSVGNMTLSCARLYVTRLLFVFNDGHFVVYPKKENNDGATSLYPKDALGYLSDAYGNTCLTGKYITDAPKVLANLALLGGITTGANAVSAAQFTTLNTGQNLSSSLTGSIPKLVAGSTIGGGAQEVLQWYKERVGDVFDVVYIPSSMNNKPTNLVLNITKTIPIDLDQKGRTLHAENTSELSSQFNVLD